MPLEQYKKYGVGELMIDSQWAVELTFVRFIKCQNSPIHFVSVRHMHCIFLASRMVFLLHIKQESINSNLLHRNSAGSSMCGISIWSWWLNRLFSDASKAGLPLVIWNQSKYQGHFSIFPIFQISFHLRLLKLRMLPISPLWFIVSKPTLVLLKNVFDFIEKVNIQ